MFGAVLLASTFALGQPAVELPRDSLDPTNQFHLYQGWDVRGGGGVARRDAELGAALDLGLRVSLTDNLMYVMPLGLGVGWKQENWQESFTFGLHGFRAGSGEPVEIVSAADVVVGRRMGPSVLLALQGSLTSLSSAQQALISWNATLGPGLIWRVSERWMLAGQLGYRRARGQVDEPMEDVFGNWDRVVIGSTFARNDVPLVQFKLNPYWSLYESSSLELSLTEGERPIHRHLVGIRFFR